MKQATTSDRTQLAHLLTQLIDDTHNAEKRTQAARLALRISMHEGDTTASDLMESLVNNRPGAPPSTTDQERLYLRATARAARRAIATAKKQKNTTPGLLFKEELTDPESIYTLIQERIAIGQLQVAQCIVKVGLSRHPQAQPLREIEEEIDCRLEESALPAPIQFPKRP